MKANEERQRTEMRAEVNRLMLMTNRALRAEGLISELVAAYGQGFVQLPKSILEAMRALLARLDGAK